MIQSHETEPLHCIKEKMNRTISEALLEPGWRELMESIFVLEQLEAQLEMIRRELMESLEKRKASARETLLQLLQREDMMNRLRGKHLKKTPQDFRDLFIDIEEAGVIGCFSRSSLCYDLEVKVARFLVSENKQKLQKELQRLCRYEELLEPWIRAFTQTKHYVSAWVKDVLTDMLTEVQKKISFLRKVCSLEFNDLQLLKRSTSLSSFVQMMQKLGLKMSEFSWEKVYYTSCKWFQFKDYDLSTTLFAIGSSAAAFRGVSGIYYSESPLQMFNYFYPCIGCFTVKSMDGFSTGKTRISQSARNTRKRLRQTNKAPKTQRENRYTLNTSGFSWEKSYYTELLLNQFDDNDPSIARFTVGIMDEVSTGKTRISRSARNTRKRLRQTNKASKAQRRHKRKLNLTKLTDSAFVYNTPHFGFCQISEAKEVRAWLVPGWETLDQEPQ
ncbi:hypothetical protein WMY93_020876 [Mugilogobius chulae]|uniref:Uncharacterized protein n=1 Tax=Mugilogobius chulae TaxID=88201 RepID=A0AAW0NDE3_9GOBI